MVGALPTRLRELQEFRGLATVHTVLFLLFPRKSHPHEASWNADFRFVTDSVAQAEVGPNARCLEVTHSVIRLLQ